MIDKNSPEQILIQKLLRDIRHEAGLNQKDLAEALGKSQTYISKCETGECRLDLLQLRKICLALGTPLEEFVRRFEEDLENNLH